MRNLPQPGLRLAELALVGARSRNPEPGSGTGDMLKATYDPANNGIVDVAEQVSFPVYPAAARPAAGAGWRGRHIRVYDTGTDEMEQVCLLNAAGGYNWVIVGQAY